MAGEATRQPTPRWARIAFVIAAALLLLVAAITLSFQLWERSFYAGMMPEKLELGWRYWHDGETGFLSGCGISAFTLSQPSLDAIARDGTAFFADVREPRDPTARLPLEEWQTTPIPPNWLGEGRLSWSLLCATHLGGHFTDRMLDALKRPGGYYALAGADATLMVLPSMGVVVLAYTD